MKNLHFVLNMSALQILESHSNGKFIGVWGFPLEVNGLLAKVLF